MLYLETKPPCNMTFSLTRLS